MARDSAIARAQAQMRACGRSHVPVAVRLKVLDSIVLPVLLFRAPSWAPSAQLLQEVDRLQRRCASLAIGVFSFPGEDSAACRRRRGRVAGEALAGSVPWSRRVALCSATRLREVWEDIASAPRSGQSWVAALLQHRDASWLAERRIAMGSLSVSAGQLGVRVAPGRAAPRFEESVLRAVVGA